MKNLYERLKPEIKKELIKQSENIPLTVDSITKHLKKHYSYLLVPYGVYSQLTTIIELEHFSDYFNDSF